MASGVLDSALQVHIQRAKGNGVTAEEMAELLTHAAFYAGWPKAWAAFRMAKDVYAEGGSARPTTVTRHAAERARSTHVLASGPRVPRAGGRCGREGASSAAQR